MLFAVDTSFDFAEEAGNGVSIPSDSPTEMANKILEIKRMSDSERENLGENGMIFVKNNHDYFQLAQKLLRVINEKLENNS